MQPTFINLYIVLCCMVGSILGCGKEEQVIADYILADVRIVENGDLLSLSNVAGPELRFWHLVLRKN